MMTPTDLVQFFPLVPKAGQVLVTLLLLAAAYGLHLLVKYYIGHLVTRPEDRQGYWSLSRNLLLVLVLALVGGVWLEELKTVSILLAGLLAATLLVNKEVFLGLTGRVALAVIKPYEIGDRIRINGICGDVIDVGLLYTWMMEVAFDQVEQQSTGRVVVLPHLWLTQHAIYNLTHGHDYIWDEILLSFPLDVDSGRVMALMVARAEELRKDEVEDARRAVLRMAERYASRNPPVTPVAYAHVSHLVSGHQQLCISLRFSVAARRRREVHSRLLLSVLEMLRAERIPLYTSFYETIPGRPRGAPDERGIG
jgi:small-conductance mechanosensitive channel